jgi:8-oxo-dGTP diphosphatase
MICVDVTLPPITASHPLLLVVAAALIDSDGRILLAQRPEGKEMAGLWEFPGGKVGKDELPETALVRELNEELGITTSPGCFSPLTFASYPYEKFHLLMPLYACRVWTGTPSPKEGQELKWVRPIDLRNYDMPPADQPFVALLPTIL